MTRGEEEDRWPNKLPKSILKRRAAKQEERRGEPINLEEVWHYRHDDLNREREKSLQLRRKISLFRYKAQFQIMYIGTNVLASTKGLYLILVQDKVGRQEPSTI
jgi:hypothetical protein